MRRLFGVLSIACLLLPLAGCDAFPVIVGDQVMVKLVNDGDYDVDVVIYIDDDQDISKSRLTEDGTKLEYTVEEGETRTFLRSCDDLQAIIIDDADLQWLGGIELETSTNVLRDGDDFGCRDTIVFTFDHTVGGLGFNVTPDVQD